jgi:hypothetical protein
LDEEDSLTMWSIEDIPDLECLFIRVHFNFIDKDDDKPKASAFTNTPKEGTNLSSDWCRYTTVEYSKRLIGLQTKKNGTFKNPDDFKMWKFFVIDLRTKVNPSQTVEHEPIFHDPIIEGTPNNRAHSIIIGEKPNRAEFRVQLVQLGLWAE